MIAVDTSALVSILLGEDDAPKFARALQNDEEPCLSAASMVELALVMKYKKGRVAQSLVKALVAKANITIIPVTEKQAEIAINASETFSKLNYGDVFSYALAKDKDIPLLFKGNDFVQADIRAVL